MSERIRALFGTRPLVGVVHLLPLPGSPGYRGSLDEILDRAIADARALAEGGVEAILVENFGDAPFHKNRVPPVTVSTMTRAVMAVRASWESPLPIGVNVLRNDARAALAILAATGASFLRINVHIGVAITDQGMVEGEAAQTLRLRAAIAPSAAILADLRVKHARPLAERPIAEEAADLVERGGADVLLVTGGRTGTAPSLDEIEAARRGTPGTPIWVASGITAENAAFWRQHADGFIVGTSLKQGGNVTAPVDPDRVRELVRRLTS